ncbi:MAG: hypothetical protein COS85_04165 [Armatimonadetes bacterium CG07_land_8_20_14_0_80_59_28]|nr:MAG: hypothetical protein COS85_04165 [Armatimonadetes bacterium CG07_land_8_20_14_0_80_59_28]PIX46160.1 MAG: hypothetical protein COZ56_00100 [Armatimonadetes bacterium CG_4_8_14_3_um_filter_58_9]PJB77707.1 MAG: hypothetical protein CO095_01285 [Armatimonadetes bacterium CG_4_9_14_3_um_filter_58_7]
MPAKMSPKNRSERYQTYTDTVLAMWKDSMRERIDATKDLVSFKCQRGDCHVHSTYSDGIGTVTDCKDWMDRAGLDFMFITDHHTVRQKVECQRYSNVWWGQEPGTQHHHLLILDIGKKYTVKMNLVRDYKRVAELGGYPIIPHPAGWFPVTWYTKEQMDALDLLGDEFAIEIINGANNLFDAFDVTDAKSIELWDHHLSRGKRVIAFGNTDAHLPQAIGDVWNAVFTPKVSRKSVLDALKSGHHFVSDAPWMQFQGTCAGRIAKMGDSLHAAPKSSVELSYECADSRGLQKIRVVRDGKVWKSINVAGRQHVTGLVMDVARAANSYYRLECFAVDRRRAYSNPIYLRIGE